MIAVLRSQCRFQTVYPVRMFARNVKQVFVKGTKRQKELDDVVRDASKQIKDLALESKVSEEEIIK